MHSFRKYGTTYARRRGTQKDFVDYRARWKSKKRVQDDYADIVLPWHDIKTAAALCIGGPVKYKVKDGCGISDEWLINHVTPGIASQFNDAVAAILAKPLLWATFDPGVSSLVPASIRQRVVTAYNALGEDARLADDQNPIEKVELVCYENNGEVIIDEIPNDVQMAVAGAGGNAETNWKNAMFAKVSNVERRQVIIQNNQANHYAMTDRRFRTLEANTSRIALQPVVRPVHRAGGQQPAPAPATLMNCPRDLYVLWQEYQHGIGGRKAARLFTPSERGRVKFKYSRRKIIWGAIDRMVRGGDIAQVACDRIYEVYGRLSVCAMATAMRQDEKNGGHPQLQ